MTIDFSKIFEHKKKILFSLKKLFQFFLIVKLGENPPLEKILIFFSLNCDGTKNLEYKKVSFFGKMKSTVL